MGKNAAAKAAEGQRNDETARQGRIKDGTASINTAFDDQFDDGFFDDLGQSYVDFARPQVDEQAANARKKLTFALARNGTLDSSMRTTQNEDLTRDVNRGLQDVADKGREYSTSARTGVESSRSDLVSLLQSTGDNVGAANAALARAETLSRPPAYSPIGQLFTDYTAGLSQQAAFERAAALGYGTPASSGAGLYAPKRTAVKVS